MKRINNVTAIKLLKSICASKKPINKKQYEFENEMYQRANEIYHNIEGERHHYAVNHYINLCIRMDKAEKVSLIWNDVEKALRNDVIAYPTLIKWCIKTNNFEKGKEIHSKIPEQHLTRNIFTQCALIHLYGHFGDIKTAKNTFYSIENGLKNSVALNTMMNCLMKNNYNTNALSLYQTFDELQNDTSHLLAIKATININDINKGKDIIAKCIDINNNSNHLLNTLIHFYGAFGEIENAKQIFKHLSFKKKVDKVTVNSMMKAFINNNINNKALHLYEKYNEPFIDERSHILALQSCININDYNKGKEIITKITNNHCIQLKSKMIEFYGDFGDTIAAKDIFDGISYKNDVIINCMIQALIHNNYNRAALSLYHDYYSIIKSNHISHILGLKAAINSNDLDGGKYIHSKISLSTNTMIQTQLIDFYGYFGDTLTAKHIFDNISEHEKDGICISAMMKCLINNEMHQEALKIYEKYESLHTFTLHALAIKSCTKTDNIEKGKRIIDSIKSNKSNQLKTSIIDFYGHFGFINDALDMFYSIDNNDKEIECINSMMNAYCKCNLNDECIRLFRRIPSPDIISYNTAIKGCMMGHLMVYGEQIYKDIKDNKRWMLSDKSVQTSLINMFSEFGILTFCDDIFGDIEHKEIEIWNVMMNAFGKSGDINKVQSLYNEMRNESNLNGDNTTFAILINACSHSGDIHQAKMIWNQIDDNKLKYDCFVVTALVDCFSRKGLFGQGLNIIYEYENVHNNTADTKAMWMSLLSGLVQHRDTKMAKQIHNEFVKRYNHNESYMSAANALLSNVHQYKCGRGGLGNPALMTTL